MVKKAISVTLDEEVMNQLEEEAVSLHLDISPRLNQILHDYFDSQEKKKVDRK